MTESSFFKKLAYWIAAIGLVSGVIAGNTFKAIYTEKVANKFAGYSEKLMERFNVFLMIQVWVAFAILAFIFWAIYCHLNNQERLMLELQSIKNELYKTND